MNLSLGFLLGSLLFLTPALVLIAAVRIYYPIHATISFLKHGLVLPAIGLFISVVINGPLFIYYIQGFLQTAPALIARVDPQLIHELIDVKQSSPFQPALWLLKKVHIQPASHYNILALVLDVHLRVFIAAVIVIAASRIVLKLFHWADAWWYVLRMGPDDEDIEELGPENCFLGIWQRLGKNPSRFVSEMPNRALWNPRAWTQYAREALYHPWALVTAFNPYREVLMADILDKHDNLYRGTFTQWIPRGEESASSVSMQYILRYYPKDGDSPRKVNFVRNNGELLFPMGEISNLHFWEIRRRAKILINIARKSDLELAKWYLALKEVNRGIIKKLVFHFERDEGSSLQTELFDWIVKHRIDPNGLEYTEPEDLKETHP